MVTIKDVAKAAGVSPSTVSRVVKDHPGISSDTKRKIRKIMQEMGYTPNVAARNLVTNKSYTIGLIVKSAVQEADSQDRCQTRIVHLLFQDTGCG